MASSNTTIERSSTQENPNTQHAGGIVFQSNKTISAIAEEAFLDLVLSNKHRIIPDEKIVYAEAENPDINLTFGEIKKQALACASSFKKEYGLKQGDVIAINSPNTLRYIIMFVAVLSAGCIFAPMRNSTLSTPEETAQDLDTLRPNLLILHHTELGDTFESAKKAGIDESRILLLNRPSTAHRLRTIDDLLESNEPEDDYYHYSKEEISDVPCCLYFTSGSTGRRKAAQVFQRGLIQLIYVLGKNSYSHMSTIIPLSFSFVSSLATGLVTPLYTGSVTYILDYDSLSLEVLLKYVEKYKIKRLTLSPFIATELIKNPSLQKKHDISSLEYMIVGGTSVDTSLCQAFERTTSIKINNVYGMTECLGFVINTPEMSLLGSVGTLYFGISVRIVDENGNDLPPGQPGELRLKGPTVTKGYYRNPEATRELFDEQGYLKTGDICKIDENMRLYHITRLKELIKYKSTHIYPIQIESILLEHPSVADCAVVGVFQKTEGTEYPRAYVILADGVEETEEVLREIQDYADAKLDEKKRLRGGVVAIKEFPRTASGKMKKFELRQWANNNA